MSHTAWPMWVCASASLRRRHRSRSLSVWAGPRRRDIRHLPAPVRLHGGRVTYEAATMAAVPPGGTGPRDPRNATRQDTNPAATQGPIGATYGNFGTSQNRAVIASAVRSGLYSAPSRFSAQGETSMSHATKTA